MAHNAYQHRGGEDMVVDAEAAMLESYGHTVQHYRRHNDELQKMSSLTAAASTLWSTRAAAEVERHCTQFRPDVIHVHNAFPLMSPSIYWAAARHRIPVVQTLHNFRLLCPQAIFLRDGVICEDCIGKLPWRAVTRQCYRQSALQSAAVAGMLTLHRAVGSYHHRVTRFITLNGFCRDKFIAGGLPAERLRIKPNFIPRGPLPQWTVRDSGLFVGRLSAEKGLDLLIQAKAMFPDAPLAVIGNGPLEHAARAAFAAAYRGLQPLDAILEHMRTARYLIVPSICYESSPRTIVEAFSCGLPVIASRLGSLPGIVREGITGLLFDPGDAADLAAKIRWAEAHPEQMRTMGKAAYQDYETHYTPERNHQLLLEIYEDAINATQTKNHAA